MSDSGGSARDVLAENLAAIRARVGMGSAQELADKVKEIGGKLDRAAISKIESKARNVSLDEALLLAAALDVAPVHLIFPLDDAEPVKIAPKLDPVSANDARWWLRGTTPLPTTNEKTYRSAWTPQSEWDLRNARVEESEAAYLQAERRLRVAKAKLQTISDDLGQLDPVVHPAATGLGAITTERDRQQSRERMEARLTVAYDEVAEATVDMQDRKRDLLRVRSENEAGRTD